MYGLLEPTESEKDAEKNGDDAKNKGPERRDSTTSSVNTQYIDEQIRRYENSQEMQQWKGAFEKTMARRFPGMTSRREDGGNSTVRAYDIFKGRHGILKENDKKPVLTFIQQIPFVPPPPPPPAQIELETKEDDSGIDVYYEADNVSRGDTNSQNNRSIVPNYMIDNALEINISTAM